MPERKNGTRHPRRWLRAFGWKPRAHPEGFVIDLMPHLERRDKQQREMTPDPVPPAPAARMKRSA